MVDPHVSLDEDTLSPAAQRLRGPLEDQLTSALKAAADKVGESYAGEDVEQVMDELVTAAKKGLHPDIAAGFDPDPTQLRALAEAIVHEHR
ncbi:hypothetical protein [Cryptosporangium phraense]|uniref:Uncharacterized protein n=1 Tax=Cryptosporangium phraense TaxID=2593070 RepID=A0A545AXN0_9ACTN|nr:hypothetical protein [Cryptosporangium phraense]TQS46080.1 hypothetical protein FL583_06255 [Cryptosporangium phraense]